MIDRGAGDKSSAVEPARGDDAARKGIPPKSAGGAVRGLGDWGTRSSLSHLLWSAISDLNDLPEGQAWCVRSIGTSVICFTLFYRRYHHEEDHRHHPGRRHAAFRLRLRRGPVPRGHGVRLSPVQLDPGGREREHRAHRRRHGLCRRLRRGDRQARGRGAGQGAGDREGRVGRPHPEAERRPDRRGHRRHVPHRRAQDHRGLHRRLLQQRPGGRRPQGQRVRQRHHARGALRREDHRPAQHLPLQRH